MTAKRPVRPVRVLPLLEWRHLAQKLDVVRHRAAFRLQIVGDRAPQARVRDEVGAVGGDGDVAAGELVFALRARLDARQAARDRGVDRLVVAELEVD